MDDNRRSTYHIRLLSFKGFELFLLQNCYYYNSTDLFPGTNMNATMNDKISYGLIGN